MKLTLSTDTSKNLLPDAKLIKLTNSERTKLAAKKFFFMFLLALAAVFIPVLHFFLVPLFLILSVVFGIKTYGTMYRLCFNNETKCIECQKPFKSEIFLDESLRVKCPNCLVHYIAEET